MSRGRLLVLLLVTAAVAAFLALRPRGREEPSAPDAAAARARSAESEPSPAPPPARAPSRRLADARAKRDALRQAIVAAQASRPAPAGSAPASQDSPPPRPPGNLTNRLGGRDALVQRVNQDFMPLADECIEQALQESPGLRGMMAISLETVADEGLGAVVDAADPAPGNEVQSASLLECIRESALSLSFPPPLVTGREKFLLTIPVEPPADAGK